MIDTPDPLQVAKEYFPHLSDEELQQIILDHTGYSCYFEGDRETVLRRQLEEYAATRERLELVVRKQAADDSQRF